MIFVCPLTLPPSTPLPSPLLSSYLSRRPIFDEDEKKILYVVSTMMDATRDVDDYKARSKLAQDLMDMLPNKIIAADEDEG